MDNYKKVIAVDFDGTIVCNQEEAHLKKEFVLLPNAKEVLNWLYSNDQFHLILWTCRNDQPLRNALEFLEKNNIKFHSINENAPFLSFSTSRKIYADYYCEDHNNVGYHVDWLKIKCDISKMFLDPVEQIVDNVIEVVNVIIPKSITI